MKLHARKLWTPEGQPADGTPEIASTLESVLRRNPDHVGANHGYVHVLEASPHREEALVSADRLRTRVPGAGHLVHRPAHISQRLGRYGESVEANRSVALEDQQCDVRTHPPNGWSGFGLKAALQAQHREADAPRRAGAGASVAECGHAPQRVRVLKPAPRQPPP